MSPPPSSETPPQLAGFPEPICAAYEEFRRTGSPDAAQEVILGALKDFLPASSAIDANAPLENSQRLIEDLGYDSLAVAEIVFFIEDLFQVRIETSDLNEVNTVGKLRAFVSRKLSEKPPAA